MLDSLLVAAGAILLLTALLFKVIRKNKPDAFQEFQAQQEKKKQEQEAAAKAKQAEQEFSTQCVRIVYGSQTGTAIRLGNNLAQECEEQNIRVQMVDVIDYKDMPLDNDNNVYIFLFATHGEGEPTDNAKTFYEYCKEESNKGSSKVYEGMQYTVFGLGKTSYEHYNAMGKFFTKAIGQMGANTVHPHGEGDDMGTLEDDFDEWKQGLWDNVKQQLRKQKTNPIVFAQGSSAPKPVQKAGKAVLVYEEGKEAQTDFDVALLEMRSQQLANAIQVDVKEVYEVRQDNREGSTLHLTLITDQKYQVGMNLGFFIENSQEVVDSLLEHTTLPASAKVTVRQEGGGRVLKLPFPPGTPVSTILRDYVDVQGPLTKKQIKDLAGIAQEEEQKEALLALQGDKETFRREVEEKEVGLLDLLKRYSMKVTIKQLVDISTRIAPRLYTISSSPLAHPGQVHLTASISQSAHRTGLASAYFRRLQHQLKQGQPVKVKVDLRESNFLLASDPATPIIMIGPGAGIAPFRGFLWHNQHLIQQEAPYYKQMSLFFGSRHHDSDFLYKEELAVLKESGALKSLHLAFSRDQEERVYVQHLLEKEGDMVMDLLDKKGKIYICGNTRMGKDVSQVLVRLMQEKRGLGLEEAQKAVSLLEEEKNLIKELWG